MQVFFACLATFSTTGASAIGYAYAAEVPQQRLRAKTAGFALAFSNLIAIMFSFCTPKMINGSAKWGVKTGFLYGDHSLFISTFPLECLKLIFSQLRWNWNGLYIYCVAHSS